MVERITSRNGDNNDWGRSGNQNKQREEKKTISRTKQRNRNKWAFKFHWLVRFVCAFLYTNLIDAYNLFHSILLCDWSFFFYLFHSFFFDLCLYVYGKQTDFDLLRRLCSIHVHFYVSIFIHLFFRIDFYIYLHSIDWWWVFFILHST